LDGGIAVTIDVSDVIAEMQRRIDATQELISKYQSAVECYGGASPPPSLLAGIRSLDKLKRQQMADLIEVGAWLALEGSR
jgi:hypothetical protein